MSKSSPGKKNHKNKAYVPPAKKRGNGALIWLSLAIVAIAAVVLLGINSQSKPYSFNYNEMPRLGSADAPVKIVEFGDFQCPSCKLFADEFEPSLVKDFIDSGKVALYFANYTIIGNDSISAAEAGESVYQQNPEAFWPFYSAVYKNQGDENDGWASPDNLVRIAKNEGIDVDYDKLLSDMKNGTYKDHIESQYNLASGKLGVSSTPTLLLNGKKISFNYYEDLKSTIENALK